MSGQHLVMADQIALWLDKVQAATKIIPGSPKRCQMINSFCASQVITGKLMKLNSCQLATMLQQKTYRRLRDALALVN